VARQSPPDGADYQAVTTTTVTTTSTSDEAAAATPTTPTTTAADTANAPQPSPTPSPLFDWKRCWYPVALVESLKTDRPNSIKLLGEPLVAWKPLGSGSDDSAWVVQRDACPHRLAPLSEGRLETDGTLQCSYHGWRFKPSGALALVPQLERADPAAHARACGGGGAGSQQQPSSSSSRGCARVHPSTVVGGVLWAWAEAEEVWGGGEKDDVRARAFAAPPSSLPPEMMTTTTPGQKPWRTNALGWYTRDVPLSLETIVDNFLCCSHVPFSHHGVMGSRDADQTLTIKPAGRGEEANAAEKLAEQRGGFSVRVQPPGGRAAYNLSFVPPGLVRYDFSGVAMLLHVTPTAVGRSRVFLTVIEPQPPTTKPRQPSFIKTLRRLLHRLDPRQLKNWWVPLYHAYNRNAVLDGDAFLIYFAQETLERGGDDWRRLFFMPSSADMGVAAWRRWMDGPGREMPMLPANAQREGLPPAVPVSRAEVFDRYSQHTVHCPHCLKALRMCNWALVGLALVGWAAVTAAVVFGLGAVGGDAAASGAASAKAAVSAGVAAFCAWAGWALWRVRMLFISYDYIHAEH
jgi:phenylpropionate dioxygenase-like ring-hydroxylating dioxygenase large terminal subunit